MNNRRTQQQQILDLLLQGFRERREITLPEILNLRIGLYNTRIKELRDDHGWKIKNRLTVVDGQRHSYYRLESAFPAPVLPDPKPCAKIPKPCGKIAENSGAFREDSGNAQGALFKIPAQPAKAWRDPETA